MTPLTYHRPQSIEEAVELLETGLPLAGGTTLTPIRRSLEAVIDLQDLGLDQYAVHGDVVSFGAALPLQRLYEEMRSLLPPFADSARREAARNLRNQGTFVGAVISGDGRSPLLCAALALDPILQLAPAAEAVSLSQLLERRRSEPRRLITQVNLNLPEAMAYEQVARAPMDRPMVSAAACRFVDSEGNTNTHISLGGFGPQPVSLDVGALEVDADIERVVEIARSEFAEAGDQWASAEYRSQVAGTLVSRVIREVMP